MSKCLTIGTEATCKSTIITMYSGKIRLQKIMQYICNQNHFIIWSNLTMSDVDTACDDIKAFPSVM